MQFSGKLFRRHRHVGPIEHVRHPQETLLKANRLLKDEGLLLIVTPDTASLSHHLMGKRWTHYKPEHFFYSTAAHFNTLRTMVDGK